MYICQANAMGKFYVKDFDSWHPLKKTINAHNSEDVPYFHEREIWFCYIGCNIGSEEDGKGVRYLRPVLIIKKFSKKLFIGIPLTTQVKKLEFYFPIGTIECKENVAMLNQIKPFSSKRLINKIGTLDHATFIATKKAASEYIFGS